MFEFFFLNFQAVDEAATASKPIDSAINDVPNDKDDKDAKKKKNRCATCRKKVGLTGKKMF